MRWKLEHILNKTGGGIIFEDESIIVVHKPSGILVLPDRFDSDKMNLRDLLKDEFGSIYVVHRIDKDTCGIILFAKTPNAHAALSMDFENRNVEKKYLALFSGVPRETKGIIELPIGERGRSGTMMVDHVNGKASITEYTVLEQFNGYSLIEARPKTGRTHQIRVHLQVIGVPILCDPIYGNEREFFLSTIKLHYRERESEKPLLKRCALHASSLRFVHPQNQTEQFFSCLLPKDMKASLKVLRKYGVQRFVNKS